MKNKFITFEGIEACGKSTQIKLLSARLKAEGNKVWVTAEPTDSPIGKLLRSFLKSGELDERTSCLLFAADRSLHEKEIKSHLNKGEWVICDRYIDSSLAYQGFNNEVYSLRVNEKFLKPDITFYIKVPVSTSMLRLQKRNGEKECFDDKDILLNVEKRYESLFKKNNKVIFIDGTENIPKVEYNIYTELNAIM